MSECKICTLKYTKSRRKEIVCKYCQFSTCGACFFNYNNTDEKETNCMNCKEFLFLNDFKNNLTGKAYTLLERKCLKEFIFKEEKKNILDTKLKLALNKKKEELLKSVNETHGYLKEAMGQIIHEKINNLSVDNFKLCQNADCKKYAYRDDDTNFYFCNYCNNHICAGCDENMSIDNISIHECDGEILKSLKSIEKETKPCPTCGIKIFKIDGCSQVMCTECKTFFDFNTGLKEKDNEPRHARGYIDIFDIFEKKVIEDKKYEEFENNKFIEREGDIWSKEEYKNVIDNIGYARTWSAMMINCRTSILRTIINSCDFKIKNENNRIKLINNKITESYFKTMSFNNFMYCKEKLELCKVLVRLHFDLKVLFNEEFRKYIEMELSDKECMQNIEIAIIKLFNIHFYGKFKIPKNGLTHKNMSKQLINVKLEYAKDKYVDIDRLRYNSEAFV